MLEHEISDRNTRSAGLSITIGPRLTSDVNEIVDYTTLSVPEPGQYQDSFHEARFIRDELGDLDSIVRQGGLSFLSKATEIDEYYRSESVGIEPGIMRIRHDGASEPLLTFKRYASSSNVTATTIDVVNPDPQLISNLRRQGQLLAVVEKERLTFKSKYHTDCMLHIDEVRGLGSFIDVKADSPTSLQKFLDQLGLNHKRVMSKSYLETKLEQGMSPFRLKVWKFHQKFQDYVVGVVSGTLTPLGFLSGTLASSDSKAAMLLVLLSAGICDGLSDSVANSQSSQSATKATFAQQVSVFLKTMTGKVVIPLSFVPIALFGTNNLAIGLMATAWAGVLLAGTAAIQAYARERSVSKAVVNILCWGAGATITGLTLGSLVSYFVK